MISKRASDVLLALLLALGIYLWQRTVFPYWTGDLFPDQLAAYFWRTGQEEWMYAPDHRFQTWHEHSLPVARSLGLECDLAPYMYPPFVAAVLSPIAAVPAEYWRHTMFAINVLLLFVFARQIVGVWKLPWGIRPFLWALTIVLLCYPMARATKLCQVVPLLVAGSWAGLLWMREGKDREAGLLTGVVGAIKLFPLAVLILPLLDRRFKLFATAMVTVIVIYAVSLLTLGLTVHGYWLETMQEFSQLVNPYFGNQSPLGWLARIAFGHSSLDERPVDFAGSAVLRVVLPLIFGGISLRALWKLRGRLISDYLALASGLILSAVILSVANSWEHYWIFVLPSLAWAIYDTLQRRDTRFWEIWLAAAAFFFLMKLTHFSYEGSVFSTLISGSHTFGMLLLWAWFIRRAEHTSARDVHRIAIPS